MIKYFVRTIEERILDDSYEQISYEKLIDYKHQPVDSFIEQLEYINDYDSILLEDDLILCENFKEEIEKVISQYPNDIINFFMYPNEYYTTHKTLKGFCYNQCTYYPKGISKKLAEKMKELRMPYNQYDTLESKGLTALNIAYIKYRPCLVQHLDNNTFIQKQHHNGIRRSIYFIDYLKELNIDYEDAYKHKYELEKLMKEKFKDLDSK